MSKQALTVVAGKLRPPRQRRDVVRREELVGRLAKGFAEEEALAGLVCAPAGSGKTTLIGSYLEDADHAVAWFQVDRLDNDASRFWIHLSAAIQQLQPAGQDRVHPAWLRTGDWTSVVAAIASTLEDLGPVMVVIDDYHHIETKAIHDGFDQLLQWLPSSAMALISTRADPPLPSLGRLRVRGTLVEVRSADLAFTAGDAAALLQRAADKEVASPHVSELVERTEGWAAGLYLAGLSMKRHESPGDVVAAFDGHDRLVADYLRSEFLAELDEQTREFMLRTSILAELSGPLCDVVAETCNSATRLRELERSNRLVIPLDNTDEWYRYHHLLMVWLQAELNATADAKTVSQLHQRASEWLRGRGQMEAAFSHAMAAGDAELGAAIVESAWHETLQSGQVMTVRDWFRALGEDIVARRLPLAAAMARLCLNTGRPHDEVEGWLNRAEDLIGPSEEGQHLEIDRSWALHLRQRGDLLAAEQRARATLAKRGSNPDPEDLTVAGSVLHLVGELEEARDLLTRSVGASRSHALDHQLAEGHLAAVDYELGYRREARHRAEEVLRAAGELGVQNWPTVLVANYVLGLLALDDQHLGDAAERLETALIQSRQSCYRPLELLVLLAVARLRSMQHQTVEARRVIELARQTRNAMPSPGRLADLVPVSGRQLQLTTPAVGPVASGRPVEDLTERELSVLRLFPSELSLRDIGGELYVSHNTVKGHVKAIYRKLDVHSRQSAIERATSIGLL